MASKRTFRIGIMGAGWPGRMHAAAFSKIEGVQVVAVADPLEGPVKTFLEQCKVPDIHSDYRAMIRSGRLDAAINCLPTGMHASSSIFALKAGLHVLCEKPPTTNVAEIKKVVATAKVKRVTYMFARQPRYLPNALEARRLVDSGALGEVYHAETKYLRCRGIPWGAGGWFVDKARGGGVLLDLGVHCIDDAWFAMGCPKPVEVFGATYCAFSHLAPKGIRYTAEDLAAGIVRFQNGATIDFAVSFALNQGGPDPEIGKKANVGINACRLYGTKAGLDLKKGILIKGGKDGVVAAPFKPRSKASDFLAQATEFVSSIREKRKPLSSAEEAVMLMQMLEGLKLSGETRKAVRIG